MKITKTQSDTVRELALIWNTTQPKAREILEQFSNYVLKNDETKIPGLGVFTKKLRGSTTHNPLGEDKRPFKYKYYSLTVRLNKEVREKLGSTIPDRVVRIKNA